MRIWLIIALVIAALGAVGSAQADPVNGGSIPLTLFNCTGPSGTPPTFQGTKMLSSANSLHLTDSTTIFRRTRIVDPITELVLTWGLQNNDRPLVTCNVIDPFTGHVLIVTGFFAPAGAGEV
jgi:hypothetical protein